MHAAAHVLMAVRYGVPVLIVIRHPEDAVRSLLIRRPELRQVTALNDYTDFYRIVQPFSNKLVIAKFETVTENIGRVVEMINRRYDRRFRWPSSVLEQEEIMASIDEANRLGHDGQVNPLFVPRPHAERERRKCELSFGGCDREMAEACEAYRRMLSDAI